MQSLGGALRMVAEDGGVEGRRRLVYSNLPPRRRPRFAWIGNVTRLMGILAIPRRTGLCGAIALFAATGIYGTVAGGHVDAVRHAAFVAADYLTARSGFGIQTVVITGHKEVREREVLRALEIGQSTSLLTFDAHWALKRLCDIAWVKSATVQKLFPGTLRIDLVEREPYALWQLGGIVSLIDRDGDVIGELADARFAGLPLVVGTGANMRVDELMSLIAPHPSVSTRLRAAVLVADRRWNLMLDNGIEIRLPETDAAASLANLDDLERDKHLLAREIELVDLRLNDRIVVRLTEKAAVQRKANLKSKGGVPQKGRDT